MHHPLRVVTAGRFPAERPTVSAGQNERRRPPAHRVGQAPDRRPHPGPPARPATTAPAAPPNNARLEIPISVAYRAVQRIASVAPKATSKTRAAGRGSNITTTLRCNAGFPDLLEPSLF